MLFSVPFAAALLGCAGAVAKIDSSAGMSGDPESLALDWLARSQELDGSFPTEAYLPRELGTVLVTGLLASVGNRSINVGPVLERSVKYIESLQSSDGAFRYARCPDVGMSTSLTLLALFAYRDRQLDSYRPKGSYVEVLDPRLLHRFFQSGVSSWDEFLDESKSSSVAMGPSALEPEDLFRAARAAFVSGDVRRALEIKSQVLVGQGHDGSWAQDGPLRGRRVIAAAYRIRILELVKALQSDTVVRR